MIPPLQIACAQAAQRKWRVWASLQLVQWQIESGNGQHELGGHNGFGITAKPGDPYVSVRTREEDADHNSYFVVRKFRRFLTEEEAFDYHACLLATAPVYAPAMKVLAADTPATHAACVQRYINLMAPHYATAHDYASVLWRGVQPLLHLDQLPPLSPHA